LIRMSKVRLDVAGLAVLGLALVGVGGAGIQPDLTAKPAPQPTIPSVQPTPAPAPVHEIPADFVLDYVSEFRGNVEPCG